MTAIRITDPSRVFRWRMYRRDADFFQAANVMCVTFRRGHIATTVQRTLPCTRLRFMVFFDCFLGVPRGKAPMDAFVLMVDDHADTREGYAAYLKFIGARVATAANGEEAVKLAVDLAPDLIVMDMRMPGLSGAEAVGRLKSDSRTARIPIITLTGAPEDAAQGCAGSLSKPCTPDRLARTIRDVLSMTKEHSQRSA